MFVIGKSKEGKTENIKYWKKYNKFEYYPHQQKVLLLIPVANKSTDR